MRRLALALAVLTGAGPAAAQSAPSTEPRNQGNATAAGAALRLQSLGYKDVHDLRRGPDGQWTGKATRHGVPSTVTVQPRGTVTAR